MSIQILLKEKIKKLFLNNPKQVYNYKKISFLLKDYFKYLKINISGLPHSPKTVKNLRPTIDILLFIAVKLLISSFIFFVKP